MKKSAMNTAGASILVVGLLIFAGGVFFWQMRQLVDVDISVVPAGSQVQLTETGSQRTFPVNIGKNRIAKGTYFYTVRTDEKEKNGLVAVNDASAIVLK